MDDITIQLLLDAGLQGVAIYLIWSVLKQNQHLIEEIRLRDNEERENLMRVIDRLADLIEEGRGDSR
ncbi:hypothetical protein [Lyngbya sp. CCY1209]|uniref:hypothetical protein n=1 Tax=Lyngbya sp. CCY1209 TaxID=2886103 RepID=UPI002D207E4E|nr:hypothetical protein [Lyngbya sp. CCY1209]MEB3884048.1 hypothetical protein [Lyngbya sp. CCY1209]